MTDPADRNDYPSVPDVVASLRERSRRLREQLRAARASNDSAKITELQPEFQQLRQEFETLHAVIGVHLDMSAALRDTLEWERRARATAETRRTEAEAAARARDEFLAMLSHELRNPLAAIVSSIEGLSRLCAHDAAETRFCAVITRQGRTLTRLIDDLLDVPRVVSGRITLARQPVELGDLTERVLADLAQARRSDGYEIRLSAERVWVEGDPLRLEQIVWNLLDNALKYTPRGGAIDVAVARERDDAVLRIRDTGQGITPDLRPRVFDLFTQGPAPRDRMRAGLGVGLTLVRRLAELHGGSVEAASEGAGRGAEFVVRVPAIEAMEAPPSPASSAVVATPRRVLLIEDHPDARDSLRMTLELMGHLVAVAPDGASGLRIAEAHPRPDVIFVDIGLPGFDGYEVARRLRAALGGHDVVLVALTGYGRPEDRQRALAAGFDHHVTKPPSLEQLAGILSPPPPGRSRAEPGPGALEERV